MTNTLREIFKRDTVSLGMLIGIPTPTIVDIVTTAGVDYVMLDTEHCSYGLDVLEHMVYAANHRGAGTLVRMANPDPDLIARVLDIGVDGLKFSKVESRQEAERIVEFCRFPPLGSRSPEPATRSASYGQMPRDEYDRSGAETVVVIGIDTRRGLENVDDIIGVDGVDGVQTGPSDMSWSLGVEKDSQEFIDAVQHIAARARALGRTPIRAAYSPEQVAQWLKRDPALRVFHWAADRMNISRFIAEGVRAVSEFAVT